MKKLFFSVFVFYAAAAAAQTNVSVFPQPRKIVWKEGQFTPGKELYLVTREAALQQPAQAASRLFTEAAGVSKIIVTGASSSSSSPSVYLSLDSGAVRQQEGYVLNITPGAIRLQARTPRGIFYGLQTLRQLVQKNKKGQASLPAVEITDHPDVAHRGTVEGFYGEPWSHQDRLEQLRFYGKFKLNTYIYGPKDDPYHSSPHWRDAYPAEKAQQLAQLVAEAKQNSVDFVWAIHPGKDIQWNREDSNAVLQKFEKMYALGVRSFAVFFDDISGAGTDARKQAGLLNFLQHRFVAIKKDVTPLIMCPTEYNKAWSNPKEGTYLDLLGEHLHPSVQVMWTGNSVIADNTTEGLQWVNKRIRRPAFVWWNFPVSDYVRDHLLLGPAYGLDATAAPHMSGFVSNPMDKAEASKLAIFSVAAYTWNLKSYDSQAAWLAAIREVMPEAPAAYRLFAAHNSDLGPNGHRYRRDESVDIKPVVDSFLNRYNRQQYSTGLAQQIKDEFTRLLPVAETIRTKSKNRRLVEQLSPWLQQFELLAKAGVSALQMTQSWQDKNFSRAWQQYLQTGTLLDSMNMVDRTLNRNPYQPGVKTGSLVLTPLVQRLYVETAKNIEKEGSSVVSRQPERASVSGSAVFTNTEKLRHQPLLSTNEQVAVSPLLEVVTLAPGDYLGLQLHPALQPSDLHFNLENNSLQSWGRFEASADGLQWQPFSVEDKKGRGVYKKLESNVRYVRFINTSGAPQSLYLRELRLNITPLAQGDEAVFAVDGSLGTWQEFSKEKSLKIALPEELVNQPLTLLLQTQGADITLSGINKKGHRMVLYKGRERFVQLNKSKTKNITALELSTEAEQPLRLYEVMKAAW